MLVRPRLHTSLACSFALIATTCVATRAAEAATYFVESGNASASDAGPGSESAPYATIQAAVNARGGSGNEIVVKPGTYREQVSIAASGTSGSAFVVRASGPGVIVEGADDFGSSGLWTSVGSGVYRAVSVTWAVDQVIVDGTRLQPNFGAGASTPANGFTWVPGVGLYVNVGGDPGSRTTLVGHRDYGFLVSGASYVRIAGFDVRRSDNKAIYLVNASHHVEVLDNVVSWTGNFGIQLSGASDCVVRGNTITRCADHGIFLTLNSTRNVIRDNESSFNDRPNARAANGIHFFASPDNRLEGNRVHDNEDTGIQINSGSTGLVSIHNRSWNNGDHGIDHLNSPNATHIGDVVYGNLKDGISFEGTSTDGRVYDCISVNNGLTVTPTENDLVVAPTAASGFVSDHNLFWNSTSAVPILFNGVFHPTIASFRTATGNEAHGVQQDPRFVDAAAGDFHLGSGSPAIDAATSAPSSWPALDADGLARFDDPATSNTGAGPVTFADIGAFEFGGTAGGGSAPTVVLNVTPTSGPAPLDVVADATGSIDPDGGALSYRFDFGDGSSVGPQPSPTATHTYAAGTWTLRVQVTDDENQTSEASQVVSAGATSEDQAPVVIAPQQVRVREAHKLSLTVYAADPDSEAITAFTADLSKLPDGDREARFAVSSDRRSGTLTWTPSYDDSGRYVVTFTASNAKSGSATLLVIVENVDRAPVVKGPSKVDVEPGARVTFRVTAFDPDGDRIRSLKMDASRLTDEDEAEFEVNSSNTSGEFTWTAPDDCEDTEKVYFTAKNALSTTLKVEVRIAESDDDDDEEEDDDDDLLAQGLTAPRVLALSSPSPNPSAGDVAFALDLPRAADVSWAVYDVQGREVFAERLAPGVGRTRLAWAGRTRDGARAGAGLYLVRVRVEDQIFVRRVTRF